MDADDRTAPADVTALLEAVNRGACARPTLVALLRAIEAAAGPEGLPGRERLHLRTAAELSFPASDLRRCRQEPHGGWTLEVNHLGLYGVDGCLPQYFLERVVQDEGAGACVRDFLDLFGEHIYHLHYAAWKRLHPVPFLHQPDNRLPAWLRALSGEAGGRDLHGGVSSGNARVLEDLLGEALGGVPVQVAEYRSSWIPVERTPLGRAGPRLGDDALLGARVHDVQAAVSVRVGPVTLEQALAHLATEDTRRGLLARVRRFAGATLDFDLRLAVRLDAAPALPLGDERLRLGWSAFLGRPARRIHELRVRRSNPHGAGPASRTDERGEANGSRIDTRAA